MLLFIYRYHIFYLTFRGFGYLVARLNADLVLSIFIISLSLCRSEWRCTELFYRSRLFGLSGVVYAVLGYVLVVDKLHPHSFDLPEGFFTMLLVGLVFGFISPLFGINIGNAAHISGFILGLVWGFLQSKIKG